MSLAATIAAHVPRVPVGATSLTGECPHVLAALEPNGWQTIGEAGWEMHLATCRACRNTVVAPLEDRRPCADCGEALGMFRQGHRPAATYCAGCATARASEALTP